MQVIRKVFCGCPDIKFLMQLKGKKNNPTLFIGIPE